MHTAAMDLPRPAGLPAMHTAALSAAPNQAPSTSTASAPASVEPRQRAGNALMTHVHTDDIMRAAIRTVLHRYWPRVLGERQGMQQWVA
jgi:hypothetical protein